MGEVVGRDAPVGMQGMWLLCSSEKSMVQKKEFIDTEPEEGRWQGRTNIEKKRNG